MLQILQNLKPKHYLFLLSSSLLLGILFYAIYNDLLIIKFSSGIVNSSLADLNVQKRKFKVIFFNKNKWVSEEKELIDSNQKEKTINYLVTSWLNLLHEEKIINEIVSVQSVMLDQAQSEAFISFDRSFLSQESSINNKLLIIHGLLKTISQNILEIKNIKLLVAHKLLQDPHLDFSHSWPISGYLNK